MRFETWSYERALFEVGISERGAGMLIVEVVDVEKPSWAMYVCAYGIHLIKSRRKSYREGCRVAITHMAFKVKYRYASNEGVIYVSPSFLLPRRDGKFGTKPVFGYMPVHWDYDDPIMPISVDEDVYRHPLKALGREIFRAVRADFYKLQSIIREKMGYGNPDWGYPW